MSFVPAAFYKHVAPNGAKNDLAREKDGDEGLGSRGQYRER